MLEATGREAALQLALPFESGSPEPDALIACPVRPKRSSKKLTDEEKAERKRLRDIESAKRKAETAERKAREKELARLARIAEAEGGHVELPAVVLRNGTVVHIPCAQVETVLRPCLDRLSVDVEHSGYDLGHKLYELRTVQLGNEFVAVVLDAADQHQMALVRWALASAKTLHAYSAIVEAVNLVLAGAISWDDFWAKMRDGVLYAKLIDPKLSGSDADKLKELAHDLLGDYAVSRPAEKAKNELFQAMGCLVQTDSTTPPERNGWYQVRKSAVTMARYAGSDVLDLAAVVRVLLPQVPVGEDVIESETRFQAGCGRVALDGFALRHPHVKLKLEEYEARRVTAQRQVEILSGGKITNPSAPGLAQFIMELDPTVQLPLSSKTGDPSADKKALAPLTGRKDIVGAIAKAALEYRHTVTTKGLLLHPFEVMCEYGDSRMRPTVYTIEAQTGRSSCRRPNGQQLSRRGGIRACVGADPGYLGITADFEGCEIRVAAGLSGDTGLLLAETSPMCYKCERDSTLQDPCPCGINAEEQKVRGHVGLHWLAAHLAFGKDATKEHRYQSKSVIFRKLFGGAPDSAVAQKIHEVFDNEIAPVYAHWDRWLRKCYYDGMMVWRDYEAGQNYATPIEGRKRLVYQAYSGRPIYVTKGPHAAGNGAIQGTARELLKDGTLRWMDGPWGHVPILPVHDQLIGFVPAQDAVAATAFLKKCMETSVLSSPGFPVHIGVDTDEPFEFWPDSS